MRVEVILVDFFNFKTLTNLVLPLPKPVHGFIIGKKNNISQALHDTQRVGCTARTYGDPTVTELLTVHLVTKKEV